MYGSPNYHALKKRQKAQIYDFQRRYIVSKPKRKIMTKEEFRAAMLRDMEAAK